MHELRELRVAGRRLRCQANKFCFGLRQISGFGDIGCVVEFQRGRFALRQAIALPNLPSGDAPHHDQSRGNDRRAVTLPELLVAFSSDFFFDFTEDIGHGIVFSLASVAAVSRQAFDHIRI